METRKKALGRGLEQLFNSENLDVEQIEKQIYESATHEEIVELDIDELRPNPYQPRQVFEPEALQELSASIQEHGVFQPIIVKKSGIKGYEIIAGERRVRASKLAGKKTVPAIIRAFNDAQMMEIALLENLQRENLSAIEEAEAYQVMLNELQITQDELARKVGKSRSHLTNMIGLLRLPKEVQTMVNEHHLSMGHARVLSKLENDEQIVEVANRVMENKMSVRELEQELDGNQFERKIKIKKPAREQNQDYKYVEDLLREKLDTKVKIKDRKIEITFTNVADLNRILEILNVEE